MKSKRLVILTQYFYPEMGAPQSRLKETADGLHHLDWEVKIVTAMPNYPKGRIFDEYCGLFLKREKVDGLEVSRYWMYASNSKKPIPRILSMLSFSMTCFFSLPSLLRFKPTYIMTESPPLTLGLSGWLLSKLIGAKHILNVSDLWPLSAYELGAMQKGILYKAIERLEKFLYRKSFLCIGQSNQIVSYIKENGASKSHLYRNGVDINRFKGLENEILRPPLKLIYAGLLGVAQGILSICQAIDFKTYNMELHIYGDGAERKDIENFVTQNPDKGIYLNQPVHRNEIPNLLKQHHIALIPLIKPIFGAVPSKIYEAMASGLPILFAGGGEGADIVTQYQAGWICQPANFMEMSKILKKIGLKPEKELQVYRKNCELAALTVFDRSIQIRQLHQVLTNSL